MRIRIAGINTVRTKLPDGSFKTYYYHRATATRLDGEPGTDAFMRSIGKAVEAYTARDSGTLNGLIRDYQNSPQFTKLSDETKNVAKWIFGKIEREYGDMTIAAIEYRDMRGRSPARVEFLKWHDRMAAKTPRGADNTLAHVQRVLSWAAYRDLLGNNPLATFQRSWQSNRADMIWLAEHIERFSAAASPEIFAAMMLALHTGQRQGDLVRMPWSAYDGSALTFRQGKSKRRLYVPCTKALREFLDGLKRGSPLILTTPTGRAWKKSNLRDQWNAVAEAAEIDGLHFHDLRGTAVTMLAEAGCTTPEIASITGHSMKTVESILERYLSRTRALAENAIAKLETLQQKHRETDVP